MSRWILLLIVWFVGMTNAQADLHIELTKSISDTTNIAFAPIGGNVSFEARTAVAKIVANDLENSGYFHVKNPSTFWLKPDQNQSQYLKASRFNIHIHINKPMMGKSQLDVYLSGKNPNDQWHGRFAYSAEKPRRLAHHVADMIYEKIKHEKSIFSTYLAYISVNHDLSYPYQLMIADSDGKQPWTLFASHEPIMSPAWSPDGQSLAYVSFENHAARIVIHDIIHNTRQIISQEPGINGAPAWSPDGQHLAYVLSNQGAPNIVMMDLKTKAIQTLTHGWSIDTEPAFSHDGKFMIFTSNRGGSAQIYRMELSTRHVTRLTYVGHYNARGRLSRDDQQLICLHHNGDDFVIARQDLRSGHMQWLTRAGLQESPSLSGNDRMVIYASRTDQRSLLEMVSMQGNITLRIPSDQGYIQEPAWSPLPKTT